MTKVVRAFLYGSLLALGSVAAASAADVSLPLKAPAPAPAPQDDFHYSIDFTAYNHFFNGQGQALYGLNGVGILDVAASWDAYKSKSGFINKVNFFMGTQERLTNDFPGYWANFAPNANGDFVEFDWWTGANVTFAKYWTLTTLYEEFRSTIVAKPGAPCYAGGNCVPFPTGKFAWVSLGLDDSFAGLPITFNPSIGIYYAMGGNTAGTICFSCKNDDYDVVLSVTPTYSVKGTPLTLKMPTTLTVGPESFWDASGKLNGGNIGYFSTGLTAIVDLKPVISAQYGNWYAKAGFTWFDLVNKNLVNDEFASVGKSTRDPVVAFVGFGVSH